jgi:hypothetical protein
MKWLELLYVTYWNKAWELHKGNAGASARNTKNVPLTSKEARQTVTVAESKSNEE